MSLDNLARNKASAMVRLGTATALICSLAMLTAAGAQAQQLSPNAAQQQVQQAFPSMNDTPAAAPATGNGAGQLSPGQTQPAAATNATPASSTDQTPAATTSATTPPPAQPDAKTLVPATPMGTAAQTVDQGQGAASAPAATDTQSANSDSSSKTSDTVPNPVEDAAAAMETQAPQKEAPAPAPDLLEKYTAKNHALESEQGSPEDGSGDALPPPNKLSMVKLEGEGFEGAASGRKVSVDVDGNLQSGKTSEELQEEIRTEAFDAAITGMFPLSPEQIQGLLKRYDKTQAAAKKPVYDDPKPEIKVENISLDPGVAPPVIKTAVGNVTTLNILDATGAPWPVQDVTWAGEFEIVEPEEGGHIIRITPMSQFAHGNIVIRLLTLKTPLTLTLQTSREVVQYRVDARIPEYGPFATAPIMQGGKSLVAGDSVLTSVLDGVASGGMVKLNVAGVDGRTTAYAMNGMTYVRTPLTLLSPAWQSSVSSADGMNVYALTNAPVLLLSDEGAFMRATLTEKEGLLDE